MYCSFEPALTNLLELNELLQLASVTCQELET